MLPVLPVLLPVLPSRGRPPLVGAEAAAQRLRRRVDVCGLKPRDLGGLDMLETEREAERVGWRRSGGRRIGV